MIYPYLAVYLADSVGLAGWMVGFVLGVRVFCQQGLTLLGGTLADRVGYKPVLIAGLLTRTAGFALFGIADSFLLVLVAAACTGFAGALFSPALRGYLAVEARGSRATIFALASVFAQAGVLTGPLVGAALLGFSFRWVALGAAATFLILATAQIRLLPSRKESFDQPGRSVWSDWSLVLRNREFVGFSLAMLAYFTLFNQIYIGFALAARRAAGSEAAIGVLITCWSLATLVGQLPVTDYLRRRWRPMTALVLGLGLMAGAFAPLMFSSLFVPGAMEGQPAGPADLVLRLTPVLVGAVILALGVMITQPFAMEVIPILADERLIATHLGFFWMANGIGATVGNTLTGMAFDLETAVGLRGLPWLFLCAVGTLSSVALRRIDVRQTARNRVTAESGAEHVGTT